MDQDLTTLWEACKPGLDKEAGLGQAAELIGKALTRGKGAFNAIKPTEGVLSGLKHGIGGAKNTLAEGMGGKQLAGGGFSLGGGLNKQLVDKPVAAIGTAGLGAAGVYDLLKDSPLFPSLLKAPGPAVAAPSPQPTSTPKDTQAMMLEVMRRRMQSQLDSGQIPANPHRSGLGKLVQNLGWG